MNDDIGYELCIQCREKFYVGNYDVSSPYCIKCLKRFVDVGGKKIEKMGEEILSLKEWIGRIEKSQQPPPKKEQVHKCIKMEYNSLKIEKHSDGEGGWYMIYSPHFAYLILCCPFCRVYLD